VAEVLEARFSKPLILFATSLSAITLIKKITVQTISVVGYQLTVVRLATLVIGG
jgi:hypothetical protein